MIDLATAAVLIRHAQSRAPGGRCLTFGKCDPGFTFEELARCMAAAGALSIEGEFAHATPRQKAVFERYRANGRLFSHKPAEAGRGFVSDELFFTFIGFDAVVSVDHGSFADADYAFDLNRPGLGALVGSADFVFDGGVMETVFHLPNFLGNVFEVLSTDGVVLHRLVDSPGAALFRCAPELFLRYYAANGYAAIDVRVDRSAGGSGAIAVGDVAGGTVDGSGSTVQCSARKTATSTSDRFPMPSVQI